MGCGRATIILLSTAFMLAGACRREDEQVDPPGETAPAVERSATAEAREPIEHLNSSELEKWLDGLEDERERWLRVERIRDDAEGGWATGAFVGGNRIEIETHDVQQFALDLSKIPIDWSRRVVLRIDGSSSELTRKHHPTVRLRSTASGGWTTVKH